MPSILFRAEVKPNKRDAFIEFIKEDARVAKECERGTLRFDLYQEPKDINSFFVYEQYRDAAAFEEHKKNGPYQRWTSESMPEMVTTFQLLFEGGALCGMMTEHSSVAKELCEIARQMGEAERSRDAPFFKTILADKLTFRRASGAIVDKDTFLKDLMNPANTFDTLVSDEVAGEVHEGMATVTLLVRAKGMPEGKPFEGVFRNIRIFVNEPDKHPQWQLHTWFNVRVPEVNTNAV